MLSHLLHFRSDRILDALVGLEEHLGGAEGEEEVKTDRDMVQVVSDVETDELVVLAVIMLDEREHQTAELLFRAFNLKGLLATIFQP